MIREQNLFLQTEEGTKAINAIKEIDGKLSTEKNGDNRTKLMMEMMLRGLQLQNLGF